ncbi:MAG: sn-glycerol-1-phosphate dehydrogenase [Bacteroidales bacterium]|nr:sn-glycerol-1-phosphate dehydrogenase [Bacteroidales bacterium]
MDKITRALERTTDTRYCILGAGVVSRSGEVFARTFPGKKAVIVADTRTWKVAGEKVEQSLNEEGIEQESPYIFDDPDFYAEWKYVERLDSYLRNRDLICIAVGSGVINDLVKYVSGSLGRQYMCVGTAASMDGYTAYGASITKDGNKQTFSCPAPEAIVMDSAIAAEAPKELAASGYADLMAKIPAAADWMLADCVGSEKIDPFSWSLVQEGLKESISSPESIRTGDVAATEALCEGLLMSGFAMQALQSSRPASGTEHQFSHFWDMEALSYPDGRHVSHGFKVGIGTLVSTAALEFLLDKGVDADIDALVAKWPLWEEMEKQIRILCAGRPGHLSRCLEESKNKYVSPEELRTQLETLQAAWPELSCRIREQILPFSTVYSNLKAVGAPYEPEMIYVSRAHLMQTLSVIPYMRNRFASIDVLHRLGYMDEFRESLFGKGARWEVKTFSSRVL